MSSSIKVPWNSLLRFRAAEISHFYSAPHISPIFQLLFPCLFSCLPQVQRTQKPRNLSVPPNELLALPPFITLLEFPQPAAPQVLPRDKQASLVCHHATIARGIVICSQEQVLPPWLDFGTFAGHILGTNPQQLVSTTDAVFTLFVHWNNVDCELPPLTSFVPF